MALDLINPNLLGLADSQRGDIMVRGASGWQRLAKGAAGQVLVAGADDPAWAWRGWVQRQVAIYDQRQTITSVIPGDDTKPQISEGVEIAAVSITPKSAASLLRVTAYMPFIQTSSGTAATGVLSIYRDAIADARATGVCNFPGLHNNHCLTLHEEAAGSTAATSFSMRWGTDQNVAMYINGHSSSRLFGGALRCLLIVDEFAA
ncbi:hypothetical protein [Ferrovibrio sp.]|uniref:hypothetical protein n=1 Tax=Ferrovibrio sp. TaxID=1917215 RepID=UPI003D15082C